MRIYGTECVKYFDGMWAFAIFDKMRNFLFLSRDRIGEKPLYFLKIIVDYILLQKLNLSDLC